MIYLDHAATSLTKPPIVLRETLNTLITPLGNPGRSGHRLSLAAAEAVYRAREEIATLTGADSPERIVFTSGATAALNLAIKGVCLALRKKGIHPLAVTDVLEHNSVLRPLYDLEREGHLDLVILSPKEGGNLWEEELLSLQPDLLVLTCRSNTTGHTYHLTETIKSLKQRGCTVIMDAAQSLGSGICTLETTGAHILCAPSHKGLCGFMGAGAMAFSSEIPHLPEAILSGGSGSDSFSREMPMLLPEALEAGTLPLPAIVSMGAGARFVMQYGLSEIQKTEKACKKHLKEGILEMGGYKIYEMHYPDGPLLVNRRGTPCQILASLLEEEGVMARAGFHCAPLAHRFLGTEKEGAVRFSFGPFTRTGEIAKALDALFRIEKKFR